MRYKNLRAKGVERILRFICNVQSRPGAVCQGNESIPHNKVLFASANRRRKQQLNFVADAGVCVSVCMQELEYLRAQLN